MKEGGDQWEPTLLQYALEGGKLQKLSQEYNCPDEPGNLLGLRLEGQDFLAVTYDNGDIIHLVNLETEETQIVHENGSYSPSMCKGEPNKIWLQSQDGKTISEFYCTTKYFTETGRSVKVSSDNFCLGYLPAPYKALVVCLRDCIQAVSCATGKLLWQLKGSVEGHTVDPEDATFHHQLQLLLVVDRVNQRILVLNPKLGHLVQTITGFKPTSFCWSKDRLLMVHYGQSSKVLISHVELTDSEKGNTFHLKNVVSAD